MAIPPAVKRRRPRVARPRRTPREAAADAVVDQGAEFCALVDAALRRGEPDAIPEDMLRRVLTAAVKAYAAKSEIADEELAPFETNTVTATETVVAACAMIRAADLNLFDVAMWFRRPMAGARDE